MVFDYAEYDLTGLMETVKYKFSEAQVGVHVKVVTWPVAQTMLKWMNFNLGRPPSGHVANLKALGQLVLGPLMALFTIVACVRLPRGCACVCVILATAKAVVLGGCSKGCL